MTMIWNISFLYFLKSKPNESCYFKSLSLNCLNFDSCPKFQNSLLYKSLNLSTWKLKQTIKCFNPTFVKFMYLKSVLKVLTLSNFLSLLSLSKVMDGLLIWFFGLKHLRLHLQNKIRPSLEFHHLIFINWGFLST